MNKQLIVYPGNYAHLSLFERHQQAALRLHALMVAVDHKRKRLALAASLAMADMTEEPVRGRLLVAFA